MIDREAMNPDPLNAQAKEAGRHAAQNWCGCGFECDCDDRADEIMRAYVAAFPPSAEFARGVEAAAQHVSMRSKEWEISAETTAFWLETLAAEVRALPASVEAGGREWFWKIVDEGGLADLPSDEENALRRLVDAAREHADANWPKAAQDTVQVPREALEALKDVHAKWDHRGSMLIGSRERKQNDADLAVATHHFLSALISLQTPAPGLGDEDRELRSLAMEALTPFAALADASDVQTNFGTTIQHAPDSYLACGLNISIASIRRARDAYAALSKRASGERSSIQSQSGKDT